MKINKFLLIAAMSVFATAFVACDEDDNYAPGKPAGSNNVAFVDPGNVVLAKTATEFDLTLVRVDTTKTVSELPEIEVPIEIVKLETDFIVPTSVTFPAGVDTVSITVKLPEEMALNKAYTFMVRVAQSFADPYVVQDNVFQCYTTITKEDYDVKYTGTYIDQFLYAEEDAAEWAVEIEYSPSLEIYRINGLFADGYPIYFQWNEEENTILITDANGEETNLVETGEAYDAENRIVVYTDEADFYYDPETKTIHLPFYWYVLPLNGGWGVVENIIVLD
ncbi:MAG: hypothetical protein MJZ73_12135 [Bacteroidaceae bacterium]|nr:hypothetical protein [Bacteroidaceae bacterium]